VRGVLTTKYRFGGQPEMIQLHVAESDRDVAWAAEWVRERQGAVLGLDSETNALDPWQPGFLLRTLQISDLEESIVLPVGLAPMGCAELVEGHGQWLCHYSEADERFLARGLPRDPVRWDELVPHFLDSQVTLAMFDPRTVTTHSPKDRIHKKIPRRKGLKENTDRWISPALAEAEIALHTRFREMADHEGIRKNLAKNDLIKWGFAHIPITDPAYLLYGALDPIGGLRLFDLCRTKLQRRGQWSRALAALTEQWIVDCATFRGMDVDGPYARWLEGELRGVVERLAPYLGSHGIRPSGLGPSVGQAFRRLGVAESPVVDRDGGEKWNKEAMKALVVRADEWFAAYGLSPDAPELAADVREVKKLAQAITDVRKADKYRTNWVLPMLRTVDEGDGASHPSVRSIGTVTTRMSVQKNWSAGPLHSLPKNDSRVRAAYRAPRGWVYVSADLKQAEPYVMAALSGDPDYLRDLQAGDINSVLAAQVYGDAYVPADGKTPGTASYPLRQNAKFAWLAACYGATERKVDALLGVHTGVLSTWKASYPVFWAHADELNQEQVISLASGHRVPLWDRFWVDDSGQLLPRTDSLGRYVPSRLGLNAETQGTQADLLKLAMHRLHHWRWSWALRFFVHDELLAAVPEWMAPTFATVLEEAMTVRLNGVTIHADATIEGRTWQPQPDYLELGDIDYDEDD
jgi:DNA polymerase-1